MNGFLKRMQTVLLVLAVVLMSGCKKQRVTPSTSEGNASATSETEQVSDHGDSSQAMVSDVQGVKLPEGLQLTKIDGTKVDVATLWSEGKYTYVDCWATWCGPCCMEIPYLEQLVSKMADQQRVQFVSISLDSEVDDWKEKIETDKPTWAQYILDPEACEALAVALDINTIPRFFVIAPDGSVCNLDAKRPSDEEIEGELRAL